MGKLTKKKIISLIFTVIMLSSLPVNAESLFQVGINTNATPTTPRSWFSSIRATTVGDLVTIVISEKSSMSNTVSLSQNKNSDTTDNWSSILDKILPGKGVVPNVDGWGGATKVSNDATLTRSDAITNSITAQVIQVLPNGNLVVQARKCVVNSGERQELILSGMINPRLIDGEGRINSEYVANMQLAIVGKGTVSRAQSDGVMNKLLRVLF